jgi:hypothetical protein
VPEPATPIETPRPRPTDLSEEQLGFRIQRAVRWLAPRTLITTGAQVFVAGLFGSFADKRELQGGLKAEVHRHDGSDDLWFDFVADLGDGFDATYSIASLLAAESLELPGEPPLPRGKVLVMGGDEVYPVASTRNYEDKNKGVYRAANPVLQQNSPTLYALPGNHDWYDGLTAFLRVFAQGRPFGGWNTEQPRSYFAIELPHRWWLFAIDTQFDDYVDAPQLEYFREASARVRRGDAVILCTPTPAWVPAGSGGESKGYDTFEFFIREICTKRGATVRLLLSGDKHHYARYAERGGTRQLITCGLGGAYLAATHELPDELELPPQKSRVRHPSPVTNYDLAERYPSKAESKAMAPGIFKLPWRNPGFWVLTGILQLAMSLAVLLGLAETSPSLFRQFSAWTPSVVVAAILVVAAIAFARFDMPKGTKTNRVAGGLHALGHVVLSVGWAVLLWWLAREVVPDIVTLVLVLVGTPVLVGFLDAELVAVYLLIASRFGINLNEAFAGQSIEDHKGFLRLHIGSDGTLTVYPIKLPTVCRNWVANPKGAEADPWIVPAGTTLRPELIEDPITIPRVSR